jgi:hypothetical protein
MPVTVRQWGNDALAEAMGRQHRADPVLPGTGGPAGNARLTAWTGAVLLVLFGVELVTLLDLDGLLGWHVAVGVLLVPPALLKTAATGWRIVGYYTRRPSYRRAGPPPVLLRVLGPLVVLGTLAVLGTGLALIAVGPAEGRTPLLTVLGFGISVLSLHQATCIGWAVVTGLHLLGRLVPAVRIVTAGRVPGRLGRVGVGVLTLLVAGVAAIVLLSASRPWTADVAHHVRHHVRSDIRPQGASPVTMAT